jgi:hypothetical protein
MQIFFSISALCLFALVAATIAIVRHVRSSRRSNNSRSSTHPQHDFAQHLFAAARDQFVTAKESFQPTHLQASPRTESSKPF